MIPLDTKDVVRVFAAEGMPRGQIAFLTHLSESTVDRILAEPSDPLPPKLSASLMGAVNTTPERE
ncbi:antitoxin Xre-like helix-turn-helix domain-containing protein [Methylorubrum subtropicum]|uniref:antitoxin Xre-like helix-turn-helix domain-containing protein n=1 Tax=Methylorubrum subtropicum TaxID=3138812 RepID=UPI00399C7739